MLLAPNAPRPRQLRACLGIEASRHHSILQMIRSGGSDGWTHTRRLPCRLPNQSVDPDLARTNGSLPLLPPGPFLREQGRTRTEAEAEAEAEAERDGEIEGEDERRGAMISPSFIITSPHQPRPLVVTTRPCNPHHRRPLITTGTGPTSTAHALSRPLNRPPRSSPLQLQRTHINHSLSNTIQQNHYC
jgi:hypothetical protein